MNAMGGLKTAYFLAGEITNTVVVAGEITEIVGTGSFYEFQLAKDTAFFNEAINVSNLTLQVQFSTKEYLLSFYRKWTQKSVTRFFC
jgi:hypothetical protein